jgi:serine/threonine protein kinase
MMSEDTIDFKILPSEAHPLKQDGDPQKIGRYEILSIIDGGGFGIVYKAYDPLLKRQVAVKLGTRGLAEEMLLNFEREGSILARLNHPHIVQVYDFGIWEKQTPYIVMEFIQGRDICKYVQNLKSLDLDKDEIFFRISKFFQQLVDALDFLSYRNVYHQDLKPSNILICEETNRLKLLDFGVAKIGNEKNEGFAATLHYCPPERFRESFLPTVTSDIYALGIVLYEVLTGRDAFLGNNTNTLINKIIEGKNDIFYKVEEKIPKPLKAISSRCIQLNPEDRYLSFLDLKAEFDHFVATMTLVNDYPYLYMMDKEQSRILFPITKEKYYIGRSFGNDLVLQNDYISRVHAILKMEEDRVFITNYSQENPILINQKPLAVHEEKELSLNDFVTIVHYNFCYVPPRKERESSQAPSVHKDAKYLDIEQVQRLLSKEKAEILKLLEQGILLQKRSETGLLLIEASSVYHYIEKASGYRNDVLNSKEKEIKRNLSGIKITVFLRGDFVGVYEFAETQPSINIGRHSSCDISLKDIEVSRFHARIDKTPEGYFLIDNHSSNGVFVFQEKVTSYKLSHGEEFSLGFHTLLFQQNSEGSKEYEDIIGNATEAIVDAGELQILHEKERKKKESVVIPLPPMKELQEQETHRKQEDLSQTQSEKSKNFSFAPMKLIWSDPFQEVKEIELSNPVTFFGNDMDCDIFINHPALLPYHAVILKEKGSYRLKNLSKKAGLSVNGREVIKYRLSPGDQIQLGEHRFRFLPL